MSQERQYLGPVFFCTCVVDDGNSGKAVALTIMLFRGEPDFLVAFVACIVIVGIAFRGSSFITSSLC
jgi:hypothetical protein